jgi:isopenicillin-N N-acyltransferase-like protein
MKNEQTAPDNPQGGTMPKKLKHILIVIVLFLSLSVPRNFLAAAESVRIPVIQARGTHYQAGYQIGTQMKTQLQELIQQSKDDVGKSKDRTWEDIRAQSQLFLEFSKKYMPEYVEEIKGAADATGIDLADLFSEMCEEIYSKNYLRGCSDLIASGDVTADGSVLAAHNNDTSPGIEKYTVVVHYQVEGEPEILAVGYGGLGISVGFNSAGISLTGNEVSMNDLKLGVPRLLLCRKILAQKTIADAISAALFQPRASNYNQVIADQNGEIYSIEGSATNYEAIYGTDGYVVHTNHYVSPRMRPYELDPYDITSSIVRYNRANRLMKNNKGRISVEMLKTFLQDHVSYPKSICRHGNEVKTTFSVIINLTTKTMLLARGNPCESTYYEYTFK